VAYFAILTKKIPPVNPTPISLKFLDYHFPKGEVVSFELESIPRTWKELVKG